MRYVGGKSKISGRLAQRILDLTPCRELYVELFVGGGSMLEKLAPHFAATIASDAHEDLILMWQALQKGWVPPAVDYDRYQELRYSTTPSPERAFAGFGGSFGGRWFEGFARGGKNSDGTDRNHQAESGRAIMRIQKAISEAQVEFRNADYREWAGSGAVIYCDPPYSRGLHDYKTGAFDSEEFWEHAENLVQRDNDVFVSEYSAPDSWVSVLDVNKRQSLIVGSAIRDIRVERLFVHSTSRMAAFGVPVSPESEGKK